jgi:hypothetical protein
LHLAALYLEKQGVLRKRDIEPLLTQAPCKDLEVVVAERVRFLNVVG